MEGTIGPRAFSISELTQLLKNKIESIFFDIWIMGEISNFFPHPSGHAYLTLKDEKATIRAIIFNYSSRSQIPRIKVGDMVSVYGKINLYEKRGEYSFIVERLEMSGLGLLLLQFEALKEKLSSEGLFSEKLKKSIPRYAETVGIITASTSAALEDIKKIARTTKFGLKLSIYPVQVQGHSAPPMIVHALRYFNTQPKQKKVDLIVIARGGGSFEDLSVFNDEEIARAIRHSKIPVITGIGHETDFAIADFVSDYRASTPSAAAQALPNAIEPSLMTIEEHTSSMKSILRFILADSERMTNSAFDSIHNNIKSVDERYLEIDELSHQIEQCLKIRIAELLAGIENILIFSLSPHRAMTHFSRNLSLVTSFSQRMRLSFIASLSFVVLSIDGNTRRLSLLNPENILKRGFTITYMNLDLSLIRRLSDVASDDVIVTKVQDGSIVSRVTHILNGPHNG